jgi:hypothetical protein
MPCARLLGLVACFALAACSGNSHADAGADADAAMTPDQGVSDGADDADPPMDDTTTTHARDFTLSARAMDAFVGQTMGIWVVESTGQNVIGFGLQAPVPGADFEFRLPDLVNEGEDARADVFIDANGNGRDDPGETTWRTTVPVNGSATVILQGTDPTSPIDTPARIPRGDFTFHMTGLTADDRMRGFQLRVIDPATRATVGGYASPMLGGSGGDLSFTLPGIVDPGAMYDVDFFIDASGNGSYDGHATDPSWHQSVSSDGTGATLNFARTDSYDELDWR